MHFWKLNTHAPKIKWFQHAKLKKSKASLQLFGMWKNFSGFCCNNTHEVMVSLHLHFGDQWSSAPFWFPRRNVMGLRRKLKNVYTVTSHVSESRWFSYFPPADICECLAKLVIRDSDSEGSHAWMAVRGITLFSLAFAGFEQYDTVRIAALRWSWWW